MKKIWGNTIVKNEDKFIWFAISSAIDYLDKMLIYDTGSIDKTVEIIKLLQKKYPSKIIFETNPTKNAQDITKVRQKMLDQTKSDWLLILDGDEIWWKNSIIKIIEIIKNKGDDLYGLVIPVFNLVGDIYHYLPDAAGKYRLMNKTGHFNIRAVNRNIKGLNIKNTYPLEGFYDGEGRIIQDMEEKIKFVNAPILHLTHLKRSSLDYGDKAVVGRSQKLKYEIGEKFPSNFKFPESLYEEAPDIVPSPWEKMSVKYKFIASLQTPLKKLKRKIK